MTDKREYAVGMRSGMFMCGHEAYFRCSPIFDTYEEAEELRVTLPQVLDRPKVIISRPPVKRGKGRCKCWEEL